MQHHPNDQVAHVNLANVLRDENDAAAAKVHYDAALALDPDLPEAHQGLAWALKELGLPGDEAHRQQGYRARALITQPYRGTGTGISLLLLVSARGGNVPTQLLIDDRRYTIHAMYPEFYDFAQPLPEHAVVMNAVGDADLCDLALERAQRWLARTDAPVINRPERVRLTGRARNAERLADIPGLIAPRIEAMSRAAILESQTLSFPVLLRSPGFHTGRHFVQVASRDELTDAVAALTGDELLVIQYLDARGPDGRARKYRVMFIDGVLYPVHLAISSDWKVHYFSADMGQNPAFRAEERRFLDDMSAVLGVRAMTALTAVCAALNLEYAGIDFGLSPDGSILLFEANATMVVFPPGPDPMWDYRRSAIQQVMEAARRMILRYADSEASEDAKGWR